MSTDHATGALPESWGEEPDGILASPANMRKYAKPGLVAYSEWTGEEYSATAGDYFWMPEDQPLEDRDGNCMTLAVQVAAHAVSISA